MWTQIVGTIRTGAVSLAQSLLERAALRDSPCLDLIAGHASRGHVADRSRLPDHRLPIVTNDGADRTIALRSVSVAECCSEVLAALERVGGSRI